MKCYREYSGNIFHPCCLLYFLYIPASRSCTTQDPVRTTILQGTRTYLGPARHAFLQFASSCEPRSKEREGANCRNNARPPSGNGSVHYTIFVSIPRGMSKSLVPSQNQCRYLCNYRSLPRHKGEVRGAAMYVCMGRQGWQGPDVPNQSMDGRAFDPGIKKACISRLLAGRCDGKVPRLEKLSRYCTVHAGLYHNTINLQKTFLFIRALR